MGDRLLGGLPCYITHTVLKIDKNSFMEHENEVQIDLL